MNLIEQFSRIHLQSESEDNSTDRNAPENEISQNESDEIVSIRNVEELTRDVEESKEKDGTKNVDNAYKNGNENQDEKCHENDIELNKEIDNEKCPENDDEEMRSDNENAENENDEDILSLYGSGDDEDGISLEIPDESARKRVRLEKSTPSSYKKQNEVAVVNPQPPSAKTYKIPMKKRTELFTVVVNNDSMAAATKSVIQEHVSIKSRLGVMKDIDPKYVAMDPRSSRLNKNPSLISVPMQKPNEVKQVVKRSLINPAPAVPLPSLLQLPTLSTPIIQSSTSQTKTMAIPSESSGKKYPLPKFMLNPLHFDSPFGLLIGNTCHLYLHDSCRSQNCQRNHFLQTNQFVRNQLDVIGLQHAIDTYDTFIIRAPKLFARFFSDFCDFFAAHKQESKLLEMVMDCSHQERRLPNLLIHILDGLCEIGIEYSVAVERIIAKLEYRSAPINTILLKMVLNERNKNLVLIETTVKKICENSKYIFPNDLLVRLIDMAIETNAQKIITLVWVVLSAHPDTQKTKLNVQITRFMEFIRDQTMANLQ